MSKMSKAHELNVRAVRVMGWPEHKSKESLKSVCFWIYPDEVRLWDGSYHEKFNPYSNANHMRWMLLRLDKQNKTMRFDELMREAAGVDGWRPNPYFWLSVDLPVIVKAACDALEENS